MPLFNTTGPELGAKIKSWLMQSDSGIAVLGALGNFFGKMPSVMQGALVLDSETSGVSNKHAVFEVAIKDISEGRVIEYHIAPYRIEVEEGKKIANYYSSFDDLLASSQRWSQERMTGTGQFSYLQDFYSDPNYLEQVKKTGSAKVGKRTYLSPEKFFRKFSKDISAAKSIHAANIGFENRMLGALLETVPVELQQEIKSKFYSSPARQSRFLYRTLDIHRQYQDAIADPSPNKWSKVGDRYLKRSKKGIVTGDILDISRASMAEAKRIGAIQTEDLFTGLGMESQKQAFSIGRYALHTSAGDVVDESKILVKQVIDFGNLSSLRKGNMRGFMTGALGLISGKGVLGDIQSLQRIESIQPVTKLRNLKQTLAHLELSRRGQDVDEFYLRGPSKTARAINMVKGAGDIVRPVGVDISWKPGIPISQAPPKVKEQAVEAWLESAPSFLKAEQYGLDIGKEYKAIRRLPISKLQKLYEPMTDPKKASAFADETFQLMKKAKVWGRKDLAQYLWKNYRPHTIATAAASLIIGGSIFNRITSRSEEYNTIEGMPHDGLGGTIRRQMTDFGSPWKSAINSLRTLFSANRRATIARTSLPSDVSNIVHFISRKGAKALYPSRSLRYELGATEDLGNVAIRAKEAILSGKYNKKIVAELEDTIKQSKILHEANFAEIPLVYKRGSMRSMRSTAYHEYGHALTGGGVYKNSKGKLSGLTAEGVLDIERAAISRLGSKIPFLQAFKHRIKQGASEVVEDFHAEYLAESLSIYRQAMRGETPTITKAYYSGAKWGSRKKGLPSKQEALAAFKLGERLHKNFIPGTDDAYNIIEGLSEEGYAKLMREGLDVKFGSGWTRDITWALPYQMSLSIDRLGPTLAKLAQERVGNLARSNITPPGLAASGVSTSIYWSSLPSVVYQAATPELSARSGNTYSNIERQSLEGMGHGGMAGRTRAWRTGFMSKWAGTQATLDASIDFAGARKPVISPDYSETLTYNNTRGYERWPEIEILIQTESPSRPMVDKTMRSMLRVRESQRIKSNTKQHLLAQEQIRTSMAAFRNAVVGSKKHVMVR